MSLGKQNKQTSLKEKRPFESYTGRGRRGPGEESRNSPGRSACMCKCIKVQLGVLTNVPLCLVFHSMHSLLPREAVFSSPRCPLCPLLDV